MNILLTGCSGFIGSNVLEKLISQDCFYVTGILRNNKKSKLLQKTFNVDSIDGTTDYSNILDNIDLVIHLAAIAHVKAPADLETIERYREVNVRGTINLAEQAVKAGVKRFIFLSSINVNGEFTFEKAFTEHDLPSPADFFGKLKSEAELGIKSSCKGKNMDFTIIRSPLVYGYGVKANFLRIVNMAQKKFPLPFGAINNKRSYINVKNLVDLIVKCIEHPRARNEIFVASDDQDISTSDLLRMIAIVSQKQSTLIPVPVFFLKCIATIFGKRKLLTKIIGNLQVDVSYTKKQLGWQPNNSIQDGIRDCITPEGK